MTEEFPHVVFLHGLFGCPEDFGPSAALLPPRFPVVAPRLPLGTGAREVESVDGLARHVARLLAERGIRRAVLAGNSLGGHLALHVARLEPGRVAGLVLSGSSGLFERSFSAVVSPALLLWGAEDRITPPAVAREFRALLPGSRLLFVDRAGHAPMLERPSIFAFHLSAFLGDLFPPRGAEAEDEDREAA